MTTELHCQPHMTTELSATDDYIAAFSARMNTEMSAKDDYIATLSVKDDYTAAL